MSIQSLIRFTRFACVAASLVGTSSHAFDMSVLKNDKEAKTHAFTVVDRAMALRDIKNLSTKENVSEKAYSILGDSINELEKNGALCDLNLYRVFTTKLAAAGIPSNSKTVMNFMIVWRSQNLVDDVFFEIMDQIAALNTAFDNTYIDTSISKKDIRGAEAAISAQSLSDDDLAYYFGGLKGFSMNNPGCGIDNWISGSNQLMGITKGKATLQAMLETGLSKNILTPDEFKILEFYRLNDVQSWNITLGRYLDIIQNSKNSDRPPTTNPAELAAQPLPNTLSSEFKDKNTGTTYRESLYYRFSPMQIGMLSDLLKKTFKRMDATKTEVVFTFSDGSETLPVSPMGQYELARKLLRKDMFDLSQSIFFKGLNITHEDLLAAALETGLISADQLKSALTIDDLWNPSVPRWKKIADFAFRVTGTATLFLPPPYNVISSIVLVFIEGQIGKKTAKPDPQDNPNDIF